MNANPSGPNQPLNQHPLPFSEYYLLAKDGQIIPGLDIASGDTLIVPPPPDGGRRLVHGFCLNVGITGTGTDSAEVVLVYKDKNNNETILGDPVTVSAGPTEDLPVSMFLVPEDKGLFLRVTTNAPGETVFVISQWADVRNIERTDTPLGESFQDVNPDTPLGNVAFSPNTDPAGEDYGIYIHNFDTVAHEFEIEITDGTTTLGPLPVTSVDPGIGVNLPIPCQTYPPGFHIRARVSLGAITTKAPVFSLPLALTNHGPARQDQGGAF
jgi:hypothetical protein